MSQKLIGKLRNPLLAPPSAGMCLHQGFYFAFLIGYHYIVDTHGLTPVVLKIKRQMQLPFIYLFLKLNVSFYDFFVYANGR